MYFFEWKGKVHDQNKILYLPIFPQNLENNYFLRFLDVVERNFKVHCKNLGYFYYYTLKHNNTLLDIF